MSASTLPACAATPCPFKSTTRCVQYHIISCSCTGPCELPHENKEVALDGHAILEARHHLLIGNELVAARLVRLVDISTLAREDEHRRGGGDVREGEQQLVPGQG